MPPPMGNQNATAEVKSPELQEELSPPPPKPTTTVTLNVYNIVEPGIMSAIGLGVYHSGLEVWGREYSFGRTDDDSCGVFWLSPRSAIPDFKESVTLGTTDKSISEFHAILERMMQTWKGNTYHVLNRNCNHFCEALAGELGFQVPTWVNRAARVGDFVVPEKLVQYVMEKIIEEPEDVPAARSYPDPMSHQQGLNLESLSVRELLSYMFRNNIDWHGCIEKSELISRIRKHEEAFHRRK